MLLFDACVDLTEHSTPPGSVLAVAAAQVREAAGAMAGAGWVSVEWCGGAPAVASRIRVFKPGADEPLSGLAGQAVSALLNMTIRKAWFTGPAVV